MIDSLPPPVLKLIRRSARDQLITLLSGLQLLPEHAANQSRQLPILEAALSEAAGDRKVRAADLSAMFQGLLHTPAGQSETEAADVFITEVVWDDRRFRIFNGALEGAEYLLDRVLRAAAEHISPGSSLSQEIKALLTLSEAVAARTGLPAGIFNRGTARTTDWPAEIVELEALGRCTVFMPKDLAELGISDTDLERWIQPSTLVGRPEAPSLNSRPLVAETDAIRLPASSLVSDALRLRIVEAVGTQELPQKVEEDFYKDALGGWLGYALRASGGVPLLLTDEDRAQGKETAIWRTPLSDSALQFDEDKIAHVFIFQLDWADAPTDSIYTPRPAPYQFRQSFAEYARRRQISLSRQHDMTGGGLTLLVVDSPGWSFPLPKQFELEDGWFVVAMTSTSFDVLLGAPDFSLLDLWKLQRTLSLVDGNQSSERSASDALSQWDAWLSGFGRVPLPPAFPHISAIPQQPKTMNAVRIFARVHRGRGQVPFPGGGHGTVERLTHASSPSAERALPILFDPFQLVLGRPMGVVITQFGPWWLVIGRPPESAEERKFHYLLWEGGLQWLHLLAEAAEGRLPNVQTPLLIEMIPTPENYDFGREPRFFKASEVAQTRLITPHDLLDRFSRPDNHGERGWVRWLAQAILMCREEAFSDVELDDWVDAVTSDPDVKMIHANEGTDPGYTVDLAERPTPYRALQKSDLSAAPQGVQAALGVSNARIEGKTNIGKFLNAAVDHHWSKCKALLSKLDRRSTLHLVCRLIEALHRHRLDSERAARARQAIYSHDPFYQLEAQFANGERDRTFLAYRVVAEMALCECPDRGGRKCGITDVDFIAAEVATLIRTAHLSDAVDRELVTAGVGFRADGSIEADEGGADAFMASYLQACVQESIDLDVDAYPDLFSHPEIEQFDADDEFFVALRDELGIDIATAATCMHALQAVASDRSEVVVALSKSELQAELERVDADIDPSTFDLFLAAFGLEHRRRWDKPPSGFAMNDIMPWHFERRLSLMMRPVLVAESGDNPLIVYGVRQIRMGIQYASTLLEIAVWPKDRLRSPIAQRYWEREELKRGKVFEDEIRELFDGDGRLAKPSIEMSTLGGDKELGQIDILVVSPSRRSWLVVECKWFGAARTPREVANWLQDFHGRGGDKLDKHLSRVKWLRENAGLAAKRLKLPAPEHIEPLIVTTSPVPLGLQKNLPDEAHVLTRRQLRELLNSGAELFAA